jgi:hypothetical protein
MNEEIGHCWRCNQEVTSDSDFCPHCGTLFEQTGILSCPNHPGERAVGVCIIDREPGCGSCLKPVTGKFLCTEHEEVEVRQDWAIAFESTDINEAELVKSVLASNGFTVHVQNFNSIGFVWDGGGDYSVSRSNIGKPAKIFVPIPEYLKAIEVIKEWSSAESENLEH